MGGGGDAAQAVTQSSQTQQSSVTNAQRTNSYTFNVSQSGLTPAEAQTLINAAANAGRQNSLLDFLSGQSQSVQNTIQGTAGAAAQGTPSGALIVIGIIVLIVILKAF